MKNKNIVFGSKYGNKYLYLENKKCTIILHPLLEEMLNAERSSQYAVSDTQRYYQEKYLFLKEHSAFNTSSIPLITKPEPEAIKIKLANLHQLVFEVTDGSANCANFMSKAAFERYDEQQLQYLAEHPHLYKKLMTEVILH